MATSKIQAGSLQWLVFIPSLLACFVRSLTQHGICCHSQSGPRIKHPCPRYPLPAHPISPPPAALHISAGTPQPTPSHQKCPCDYLRFSTVCVSAANAMRVHLEIASQAFQPFPVLSLSDCQAASSAIVFLK